MSRHLGELGQFYGLSRERIRQIEAKAMSHVESYVRQASQEDDAVRAAVFNLNIIISRLCDCVR